VKGPVEAGARSTIQLVTPLAESQVSTTLVPPSACSDVGVAGGNTQPASVFTAGAVQEKAQAPAMQVADPLVGTVQALAQVPQWVSEVCRSTHASWQSVALPLQVGAMAQVPAVAQYSPVAHSPSLRQWI